MDKLDPGALMLVGIDYGREHLDVDVPESRLVGVTRHSSAPGLADPAQAVREALETPLGFPALRRALTPDDHVVIVLDEQLPRLVELLTPVLEHVLQAQVAPEAITVVCPPSLASHDWVDALRDASQEVRVETHDPTDRTKLSYLATTRRGRRLYLNRTAVDADQIVVLARRGFDPLLGYSGSEGALYPALSDEATRKEMCGMLSLEVPGAKPWPVRREATEVAWLLGAPFMVHVIPGAGDEVANVVSGLGDTDAEGLRLLNARWRVTVDGPADTVIASVSGHAGRHTFADLAAALACAARVVRPDGRLVLLSQAGPTLGAGAELLRQADDPGEALNQLRRQMPADMAAAFQWASAAQVARIYFLSDLPSETAEELFTVPLDQASQVQRLLRGEGSCLFLPDADKTLAVISHHRDHREEDQV
jgi:nickel-dependent lactate racemase